MLLSTLHYGLFYTGVEETIYCSKKSRDIGIHTIVRGFNSDKSIKWLLSFHSTSKMLLKKHNSLQFLGYLIRTIDNWKDTPSWENITDQYKNHFYRIWPLLALITASHRLSILLRRFWIVFWPIWFKYSWIATRRSRMEAPGFPINRKQISNICN